MTHHTLLSAVPPQPASDVDRFLSEALHDADVVILDRPANPARFLICTSSSCDWWPYLAPFLQGRGGGVTGPIYPPCNVGALFFFPLLCTCTPYIGLHKLTFLYIIRGWGPPGLMTTLRLGIAGQGAKTPRSWVVGTRLVGGLPHARVE